MFDNQIASFYKLNLSNDLIMFLVHCSLFEQDLTKEEKMELVDELLTKWSHRIETNIHLIIEQTLPQIAQEHGIDLDEARILTSIHQHAPKALRIEYINELREILSKSFDNVKT